MTETYDLGSTPSEEDCAQVGTDGYHERVWAECKAYRNQLYRVLEQNGYPKEKLPQSFRLTIKGYQHDLGTYHELVAKFDDSDEKCWNIINLLDEIIPQYWDDAAKEELKKACNNESI